MIESQRKHFIEINDRIISNRSVFNRVIADPSLVVDTDEGYVYFKYLERAVPEKEFNFSLTVVPNDYLITDILNNDVIEYVRAQYWLYEQKMSYTDEVIIKVKEVDEVLRTHPYKLTPTRILTLVSSIITDMDISFYDKFKTKKLRKSDIQDIIFVLMQYGLIPKLYREAVSYIAGEYMDRQVLIGGSPPVLEIVTSSDIKGAEIKEILSQSEIRLEEIVVKAYNFQELQGDYDEIVTHKVQQLNSPRPVICEDSGLELDCLNGCPGPYVKQFMSKNSLQLIYSLCKMKRSFGATWVSSVAVGDEESAVSYVSRRRVVIVPPDKESETFDSIISFDGVVFAQMTLEQKREFSPMYAAVSSSIDRLRELIQLYKKRNSDVFSLTSCSDESVEQDSDDDYFIDPG